MTVTAATAAPTTATQVKAPRSFRIDILTGRTKGSVFITASGKTARYMFEILPGLRKAYFSEFGSEAIYEVNVSGVSPTCECVGFTTRGKCKHSAIVAPLTLACLAKGGA